MVGPSVRTSLKDSLIDNLVMLKSGPKIQAIKKKLFFLKIT